MCCKLVKPFREDGQALRLNEKPNAGDITGSHSYTNYTSEVNECASLGTCGYVDDQPFNSSRVVGSQLYNVRLLTARFPPLLTPAPHRPVVLTSSLRTTQRGTRPATEAAERPEDKWRYPDGKMTIKVGYQPPLPSPRVWHSAAATVARSGPADHRRHSHRQAKGHALLHRRRV